MGYGPYNNNRYSGDRYSNRNYGYNGRDYMENNNRRYMENNNRRDFMDYNRYSPVNYRDGRDYNRNHDRTFRSDEYGRTFRSPMDSHRQDYPSYTMGRMEDQFGYKKWWDSN